MKPPVKTKPPEAGKTLVSMTDELARSILEDILTAPADDAVPLDQKIDALKVLSAYNEKAQKSQPSPQGSAFNAYRGS